MQHSSAVSTGNNYRKGSYKPDTKAFLDGVNREPRRPRAADIAKDNDRKHIFKARPLDNKIVSSRRDIGIFRKSKRETAVSLLEAAEVKSGDVVNAVDSSLFKNWLRNLESETGILADGTMTLKQVIIQGVDMFGERIGFLKFKADILDKGSGHKVPGIVFARGPAVAVLILLESDDGETYAVLTEQVRVPTGKIVLELPAGMLDDDEGDFVGTAVREVEEEIGIKLRKEEMVDLTAFLDPSTGHRIFPSPGGCDEEISVFLYRRQVEQETIRQLQGKETGLREHGEFIKVRLVPYRELWRKTADAKVLMSIGLYEMAQRVGLVPRH
ncbi:hypothetical protein YC2023_116682 [Brassica napus]